MADAARYDGLADWYDAYVTGDRAGITTLARDALVRMLEGGRGRCLDLCCGAGVHVPALLELGWSVVGVDESEDQLRVARERTSDAKFVRADAARLPFEDRSFNAVVAMFVSTDVDDFAVVMREAARVLVPGGRFVHVGTHPCFVGPFAELAPGGKRVIHQGYRETRWTREGPGIGRGIRSRVGVNHLPLGDFLTALAAAGLRLERADEPGDDPVPALLAVAAVRP